MHALLAAPAIERDLALRGFQPSLHAADIAACAECAAAPGQHQRPDLRVARDRLERSHKFRAHIVAHGISTVGPVQSDGGDAGVD